MNQSDEQWILCPVCGAKTRARLLPDTILRNFPLFCPPMPLRMRHPLPGRKNGRSCIGIKAMR